MSFRQPGVVTGGSAFSFTIGRYGFLAGRQPGDFDLDQKITILDQVVLTDFIAGPLQPRSSVKLLGSDIAPQAGTGGRAFGDGTIDSLDHDLLFRVIMGRARVNPVLSGSSLERAAPGDNLVLYGSGFMPGASGNRVVFTSPGGSPVTVPAASVNADCTELAVTVPGGMRFITAVHAECDNLPGNSLFFLLENIPVITGLVPGSGRPGASLVLRGYEFGFTPGDNLVSFNGVQAAVTSAGIAGDYDALYVIVPAGVSASPVTVTVGGITSNAMPFTLDGPPEVAIASPLSDSEITAPVRITGTVSDLKLTGYTLDYALSGEADFTTLTAGSSPVDNGILGVFDPTMLLNGLYTIRLTAVDADGYVSSVSVAYRVKGGMKIGNFTVAFQDLAVPVAGIPITVNRTYDSRDKGSHDFGYGWSIDIRTTKVKENKTIGAGWIQTSTGDVYYLNPAGKRYVIVALPDGRMEEFDVVTDTAYSWIFPFQTINFTLAFVPGPGQPLLYAWRNPGCSSWPGPISWICIPWRSMIRCTLSSLPWMEHNTGSIKSRGSRG